MMAVPPVLRGVTLCGVVLQNEDFLCVRIQASPKLLSCKDSLTYSPRLVY